MNGILKRYATAKTRSIKLFYEKTINSDMLFVFA
jgi:hypothetical protein